MVSFQIFVKAMLRSLSELKFLPSFCFAFKIPDDRAVTNTYLLLLWNLCTAIIYLITMKNGVKNIQATVYDGFVQ